MRGFTRYGLLQLIVFVPVFLVFAQGCTRSVLQTYPAGEQEIELAAEAFAHYRRISAEECPCCLDAEADAALSLSGWFSNRTGKLSGYIQAMEPGYIKFVAINPLGQPLYIFSTNGDMFKSLNVFEEKAYSGSVRSEIYRKFASPGFEPEFFYYWLTGRLQPEDVQIRAVMRDREQEKFWLQLSHANSSSDSMVLFDPEELIILRHVLRDEQGKHLVDILYEDHQPLPGIENKQTENDPETVSVSATGRGICTIPGRITVSSKADAGKLELILYSLIDDAQFTPEDFQLQVPDNFEQLLVQ